MIDLLSNRIIGLTKDLFIIESLRSGRSLIKLLVLVKVVTQMVRGCLRMMKVAIFALSA